MWRSVGAGAGFLAGLEIERPYTVGRAEEEKQGFGMAGDMAAAAAAAGLAGVGADMASSAVVGFAHTS